MLTVLLLLALVTGQPPQAPPVLAPEPPQAPPVREAKTSRVQVHGRWYDRHSDGTLDYCWPCYGGKLPPAGSPVTREELDAFVRAGLITRSAADSAHPYPAPAVAAPQPFRR